MQSFQEQMLLKIKLNVFTGFSNVEVVNDFQGHVGGTS